MKNKNMDLLYVNFDKNLYRIHSSVEQDPNNPGAINHSALQVSYVGASKEEVHPGSILSGSIAGNLEFTGGYIQSQNFVSGSTGWRLSSNGSFEGNSGTFRGSISASSINIPDTVTANSFHVDSSGNTWWGATTLAASTANVTSAGIATFAGISSLNMKAYTSFETSARFISTLVGSGTNTFGNQGVTVAPGITATSSARLLWWITQYVFNNNPTFTCSMLALGGFGVGDGRAWIGMGAPTINGSSLSVLSVSCAGFRFQKISGVTTVVASNNNGDASNSTETSLITIVDNDSLELIVRMTAANIKYYYRKNGGALTLGATHTTRMPTASETYIMFGATNSGTTDNFQVQLQCAAYEH